MSMELRNEQEKEAAAVQATALLHNSKTLAKPLSSIPTLVSLRDVVKEPPLAGESPSTLLTPNRGHYALLRALEDLETLDNPVILEQDTLLKLTCAVTNAPLDSGDEALQALQVMGMSIPRRVCQHPFRKNDIVWVCRTCQADETCVLCHSCYSQSNHEGHDVAFYHAQAGGCCDCGDPDAWDPAGFCPHHGPPQSGHTGGLDANIISRVKGIVPSAVDWLVHTIAANAEIAHARAKSTGGATRREDTATNVDDEDESLGDDDVDEEMAIELEHVFVPAAASTSKSMHGSLNNSISFDRDAPSITQNLGVDGREGHGLYLILHTDDNIHTPSQIVEALRDLYGGSSYFTDSVLGRLARVLKQYGQLVVWGSMEVVGACSSTHVDCWLDGDNVASSRIGAAMLGKAACLARHGLVCSIATRQELQFEQRAVAVLRWLSELARSCDPLCQTVAESILSESHLVPMLRSDFKLSASITKAWHSLLLTLLAVPVFKSNLANAYCDTYRFVTAEYAHGMGVYERSSFTLSVQFLNRVTYVVGLVRKRDLLGKLGKALLETLSVAQTPKSLNHRLNPDHFVLSNRRYSPCISDLKCVLNVKGMARLFVSSAGTFLQDWLDALSLAQFMDEITWRATSQGHVEIELRGWVGAFNASISLGSLFERLLSWDDDDASPIAPSKSPLAQNLQTCVELTFYIMMQAVAKWQTEETMRYRTRVVQETFAGQHSLCPASLSFSTIASQHGTRLAFDGLPISQATEWSFHLPLHRFLAASLREVCRRRNDSSTGMKGLMDQLTTRVPEAELDSLFRGLMEFPALVLSRAAQIRAGLWRRNGSATNDQVLNYAEPPFCRALRDADILLLQFAALVRRPQGDELGCSLMIHLLLHRFGLFDFMGLTQAPATDIERYKEELALRFYDAEQQIDSKAHDGGIVLPWTYTPAKDVAPSLALLEEFFHLLIVLVTELPSIPPTNQDEHTSQAKQRLRREVVHRLASGPKTHSELTEVQHVLSHWDNYFLSEEGKVDNPDDASGAELGKVLSDIAERKSRGVKLSPDQWELRRDAWNEYDPAFFHISPRSHQLASDLRPKLMVVKEAVFGVESKPLAPSKQIPPHPYFQRLQRDITVDATVLAMIYRTLHVHCSGQKAEVRQNFDALGKAAMAYHSDAMSETALARAVHLLTLGAFAWQDASAGDREWRNSGGGSAGSIFHGRSSEAPAPTAQDWVALALMSPPDQLMDSAWYDGEENTLVLLRRLAVDGGTRGGFISEDQALRSGAAWLCEFAICNHEEVRELVSPKSMNSAESKSGDADKSDLERRKQAAKARAMERMKAQAAQFAAKMKIETDEMDEDTKSDDDARNVSQAAETPPRHHRALSRSSTMGSEQSIHSASTPSRSPHRSELGIPQFFSMASSGGDVLFDDSENEIPDRLLKERPQCIICVEDGSETARVEAHVSRSDDEESNRKRSRRKTGSNALAFVGYAQASTVQKGGGGPPPAIDDFSPLSMVRRFAGTHVALCGHAVHSECCESYLATVAHREDRAVGRRDEFRCPFCQRLSNCLVPFIDVGVDWTDSPNGSEGDVDMKIPSDASDVEAKRTMEALTEEEPREVSKLDLNRFLSTSPWWVGRNDNTVAWDGQCAFIAAESLVVKSDSNQDQDVDLDDGSPKIQRRKSVRSLRKKDLYVAWTAMMRTPRFVRRRLRSKNSSLSDGAMTDSSAVATWPSPETSSGETLVWRRLMDLLSETAFKADGKRLGERYLHQYCGEFRHYIVEKSAYNIANRESGKPNIEWPACISSSALSDTRRQELSREKLLSKLLMTVQSFTYSCCCESREVKRLLQREAASRMRSSDAAHDTSSFQSIFSNYGVGSVACDGKLVLMPTASKEGDGTQPFAGRLGKLRYFGLAVIAAAGAVSADLVQLAMCFPTDKEAPAVDDPLTMYFDYPTRAPVAFPLLLGHVLTHVVAAMCATCGRARARSDSLELVWPAPFSKRGSFGGAIGEENESLSLSVVKDCEGFIKLGILARLLQVLLSHMDIKSDARSDNRDAFVLTALRRMMESENGDSKQSRWSQACFLLLETALLKGNALSDVSGSGIVLPAGANVFMEEQFRNACSVAASEIVSFVADVGVIFQMLVPGVVETFDLSTSGEYVGRGDDLKSTLDTLAKLHMCLGLETIEAMLQASLVQDVISNWYETSRLHARSSVADESELFHSSKVRSRLFQTEGFRSFDWPMDSIRPYVTPQVDTESPGRANLNVVMTSPMRIDSDRTGSPVPFAHSDARPAASSPLVALSSKESIDLIGGYAVTGRGPPKAHPRVAKLPTAFTDLYATLGALYPNNDQTALCLICGEVLNAGGKGECTKHSYYCGAGSCVFFLLQDCMGLILHGDQAAYVYSPYIDAHGETPQFRGRPLNLDLDRYSLLHELWSGHTIRQRVVSERGGARQIIIPDFY